MSEWMKEMERLVDEHDPIPDCDCKRCAITERDRLRAALLAHAAQRDVHQLDDINVADLMQADDSSKERVQSVGPCKQINSGHVCGAPRRDSERVCPDCNPQSVELPEPVAFGFANTAITGGGPRLMIVRLDIPVGDPYGGALWHPLVLLDEARTYGDAREAAGYARGREEAGRDAARYRWLRGDCCSNSERWTRWEIQRWDGVWNPIQGMEMDAYVDAALRGEVKP